jgi:hypothetical protein
VRRALGFPGSFEGGSGDLVCAGSVDEQESNLIRIDKLRSRSMPQRRRAFDDAPGGRLPKI